MQRQEKRLIGQPLFLSLVKIVLTITGLKTIHRFSKTTIQ